MWRSRSRGMSVGINGKGVCARAALDERRANDSRVAWCCEKQRGRRERREARGGESTNGRAAGEKQPEKHGHDGSQQAAKRIRRPAAALLVSWPVPSRTSFRHSLPSAGTKPLRFAQTPNFPHPDEPCYFNPRTDHEAPDCLWCTPRAGLGTRTPNHLASIVQHAHSRPAAPEGTRSVRDHYHEWLRQAEQSLLQFPRRHAIREQAAEIVFAPEHLGRASEKGRLSDARNLAHPAGVCHHLIDNMAASDCRRRLRAGFVPAPYEQGEKNEMRWHVMPAEPKSNSFDELKPHMRTWRTTQATVVHRVVYYVGKTW
ncbi:hypothetical protein PSPO01_14435 [Paraphaeosphaeria sporulosa]